MSEELKMVLERLERIESASTSLSDRQRVQEFYTVEEFAKIAGGSEFTTREWCHHRRINAQRRSSGRGSFCIWVISHSELVRYQKEGLPALERGSYTKVSQFRVRQRGQKRDHLKYSEQSGVHSGQFEVAKFRYFDVSGYFK